MNELSTMPGVGQAMQQVKTEYATAIAIQKPRALAEVETRLVQEANLAGVKFFYAWGAGKERIEGASVNLALAAARCYGNCAVDMQPVQETSSAWIFSATFVDLETGFTLTRQFSQSKSWTVYGKHDEARKETIRFQIGQSKAIRNVVLNCIPAGLITRAIDAAMGNVRQGIENSVKQHGMETVVGWALQKLAAVGVDEIRVLAKFGRRSSKAITVDDLVLIRADLTAIEGEQDDADELYPQIADASAPTGESFDTVLMPATTADELKKPKRSPKKRTQTKAAKAAKSADTSPDAAAKPDVSLFTGDASETAVESLQRQIRAAGDAEALRQVVEMEVAEAQKAGTITDDDVAELYALANARSVELAAELEE